MGNNTAGARVHDAAAELNVNARFGRWEIVGDHVDPTAMEAFNKRHEGWGSRIRILDTELSGAKAKGDKETELVVRYSWYRPDHQTLKTSDVAQSWRLTKNGWKLFSEEVRSGDQGLFAEAPSKKGLADAEFDGRSGTPLGRFQTIRIGAPIPAPTDP